MSQSNVKVYVRLRPVMHEEGEEPEEACCRAIGHNKVELLNWRNTLGTVEYIFNQVFDEDSTQGEVFCTCVQPLISRFIEQRQNVTVFTYGPTGAGKTYTILGTNEQPGIIPRSIKTLFSKVRQMTSQEETFTLSMSYLEIYQEKVFDLLTNNKDLQIRQDQAGNIFVPGLTTQDITNFEMFERLFVPASENRTVGVTKMNLRSSRSHSILLIQLKCRKTSKPHVHQTAKLCLIDLAGSEDNRRTGNTGVRLKESGSINTSLHVLSKVVDALNTPSTSRIPYRDSKLTRLLQDSLGGSAHTCTIVNIGPEMSSLLDTQSTLNFATKSRCVVNRPFTRETKSEAKENTSPVKKEAMVPQQAEAKPPPAPFLSPLIKKHMKKFESKFLDKIVDLEKLVMKSQEEQRENKAGSESHLGVEEKFQEHDLQLDEIRKNTNKLKTLQAQQRELNEQKRRLREEEALLADDSFSPLIIKRKKVSTAAKKSNQPAVSKLLSRSTMLWIEKQSVSNRNDQEIITITIPADTSEMHSAKILRILNTGSEKELKLLHGIGSKRAAQILQYRQENGDFKSVQSLEHVLPKQFAQKFLESTLLHSCEVHST